MIHVKNIYDETGWHNAEGYHDGTRIKKLRDDVDSKTILLKLPPGFVLNSHTHIHNEQHLVLEGEYESEGRQYTSGTYRFIPAHKDHGPFTSKTGAIVLVIWDHIK
ncbi:MAG TPA: cupin domain-containing protein [Ignavibacteriaceae bacterium]|nr:cupin domain-containing protein [Ignavibacteriaceae bacterium]